MALMLAAFWVIWHVSVLRRCCLTFFFHALLRHTHFRLRLWGQVDSGVETRRFGDPPLLDTLSSDLLSVQVWNKYKKSFFEMKGMANCVHVHLSPERLSTTPGSNTVIVHQRQCTKCRWWRWWKVGGRVVWVMVQVCIICIRWMMQAFGNWWKWRRQIYKTHTHTHTHIQYLQSGSLCVSPKKAQQRRQSQSELEVLQWLSGD